VLERCTGYRQKTDLLKPGRTAEGLVRYAGFLMVAATLEAWNAPNEGPKLLKAFGVDAKKVLDEVAPEPKAKRPEAAKPKAKAAAPDAGGVTVVETGKHAGDVRRAKKQKGEAQCHGRAGGFFHHGVCAMNLLGYCVRSRCSPSWRWRHPGGRSCRRLLQRLHRLCRWHEL
jgi:hypothetical protein